MPELRPAKGAVTKRTRKGRGNASGKGGESGRGHKGQKSRSGYSRKAGFEGGQMPLYRRIPKKRGFTALNKEVYQPINLSTLNTMFEENAVVDLAALCEKGLIKKDDKVKVLANGELKKKLTIKVHKFSESAIKKIEEAKATFEILS